MAPESELKHDEDLSRLRRALRPVIRPSARWVRMTVDELKRAAESRHNDIESVIGILSDKSEDGDLDDYDDWIYDFLRTEGNDVKTLAKLLVDAKYDSPWILRPDYFQSLSSRMDDEYARNSAKLSNRDTFREGRTEDNQRLDTRKHPRVDEERDFFTPDLMLGLAGFIPMPRPGLEDSPSLRHESWLEDISRHLLVDPKDNSKVSVVFGKRCRPGSSKSVYLLAKQILDSITTLREVVANLKDRGLCPNTLPILIKREDHSSTGVIEVVDIKISEIATLWKALVNLVNDIELKHLHPDPETQRTELSMRPSLFPRLNLLYDFVDFICKFGLSCSVYLLAIPLFFSLWLFRTISNNPIHHHRLQNFGNSSIMEVLDPVNSILAKIGSQSVRVSTMDYILGQIHPGHGGEISLGGTIYHHHESLCIEMEALHYTALCVQMMCLALQSFSQAHTGELHFSFITHGISKVYLLGAGEPFRTITAYQQKLTCFEGMIKSKVLVFQIREPSGQPFSDPVGDQPCDIISSLDNIIHIWGSSQSDYRVYLESETAIENIFWIGGGAIHPSRQTFQENEFIDFWHWTSETDPNLPSILRAVKKLDFLNHLDSGTKIRIGALAINKSCPLSSDVDQKSFRRIAQDHLGALEAFAPHWDLNTAQVGLQGGQWVVPQIMIGWQKLPGRTRKQGVLDPGNCLLIPELSKYWGVQMSLCTGVLRRVSLQEVIATCIEPYMACRLPQMKEWPGLKKIHCMVDALHGSKLPSWFQDLPDEYQIPASIIIREILNRLQHTGIDDENMLRIGWVQRDTGLECLKIPCTRANSWAKMLVDCTETVTFACVTHLCLETTGRVRTCSKIRPATFDTARPLQLSTQVRPRGVDYSSRTSSDGWKIQRGRSYWMGREDLMLLANVAEESGSTVLKVKRSSMPVKLFKRMNTRATVRETNDDGAVECIIVADDS